MKGTPHSFNDSRDISQGIRPIVQVIGTGNSCLLAFCLEVVITASYFIATSYEKAAVGFEPTDNGFAIRPLSPLGHAAVHLRAYPEYFDLYRSADMILRRPYQDEPYVL